MLPQSAPEWTLRGRERQIAALEQALDLAADGRPATVWLEGEAGIGKTRLLSEAVTAARERGFHLAAAQGDEAERTRPFGPVADAFGCVRGAADPRRAAIADLLAGRHDPSGSAVTVSSDPGLRFRVVDAFADLSEELAAAGPVVLALDDLQWADASTVLALGAIRRRTVGLPLVLIGCFRPVPDRAPLRRLVEAAADGQTQHLRLEPLSQDAVRAIVTEVVGAEPGARLLAEVARAGGNVLFVTELLSALMRDGAVHQVRGTAEIDAETVSPTLRVAILHRLSDLPGDTVQALRSASILGERFTPTDLATVTGEPVADLSGALLPALTAHVLSDDANGLRFRHDLVHDAVYHDIPASIRVALHRDAGRRLASAGASARVVAAQFARAAQPGDREAADWLLRAAREDAPRFPDVAAELFDTALKLMDPAETGYDRIRVEQADTLMRAGDTNASIAVCRAMLEDPHADAAEPGALLRLGSALIVTGDPQQAVGYLDRLARHEAATSDQQALGAGENATAQLWLGDLDRCEDAADRARELAAEVVSEPAMTGALAARSVVAGLRGDFAQAIEFSDAALRGVQASDDRTAYQYPVHATRGFLLIEMDRFDEARAELDAGRRRCEQGGVLWPLPTYQAYLALMYFARGDWDDAASELETSAQLIEETGIRFAATLVHATRALISLHRNDLPAARGSIAAATTALDQGPRYVQHRIQGARALVLEAEGDRAAAFTTLTAAWHGCVQSGIVLDHRLLGPDLVRLSLELGETALAEQVTEIVQDANPSGVRSREAAARLCRGMIEDDAVRLAEAAAAYGDAHRPLEAALASQRAALSFARHGHTERATALFDAADATFHRLGAHRDLRRLDADRRTAGMPPGRRGPRRRPAWGWASLTETERAVAGLVAEGLTNPQIGERLYVSRRTVQTHVSHIFRKLDLSSRAQLATEITRRDTTGTATRPSRVAGSDT